MHESPEFNIIWIICLVLTAGAAMRVFAKRIKIPYTITMLLLGLIAGLLIPESHAGEGEPGLVARLLGPLLEGGKIRPELIMLIFLPALVFESAFALDVHAFRRDLGPILLLALPAVLASTAVTAGLMFGVTSFSWDWGLPAALVFGALISATDPVAVVSILRDVGAPKRLGLLIEGESLLNDGTAIVIFTVLVGMLAGAEFEGVALTLINFVWVVAGGIGVGWLLAFIATHWVARTFNEPLIEITLTIVLAYLSMSIAEHLLHVSGVMAVVTAGLYMSGPGRPQISPEISHFLHQFWEMLAYIANTLIFFLVGLVVATAIQEALPTDFLLVLAAYVGIMAIRFVMSHAFRPLMNMVGDTISKQEATVMAWGGLRGAVSLALALIVSQHPSIDESLGRQILLVTVGVVFLTIVLNGSTTGWLLKHFKFDEPPLGEWLAALTARAAVLEGVSKKLETVSQSRDLRAVYWPPIKERLGKRIDAIGREIEEAQDQLRHSEASERSRGYWNQVLSIERQAYWAAHAQGTLRAGALLILNHEINLQLDRLAHKQAEPPETRLPAVKGASTGLLAKLRGGGSDFDRLSLIYDLSRAEASAADKVLEELENLKGVEAEVLDSIREIYRGYLRKSKERLEDLRANLPEITQAIETRLAHRIELNLERAGYSDLTHSGTLDQEAGKAALMSVERRMKELQFTATKAQLPKIADLCKNAPLFESLDAAGMEQVGQMTSEQVMAPSETLFKEGDPGDSMFIIARGAMLVSKQIDGKDVVLDILGGGDIIGEMALLTGAPRTATVRASTSAILGKISRESFRRVMQTQPRVRDQIWDAFTHRQFDNHLRHRPEFAHLNHEQRLKWVRAGTRDELDAGREFVPTVSFIFVATGSIRVGDGIYNAPAIIDCEKGQKLRAEKRSNVVFLPPLEETLSEASP